MLGPMPETSAPPDSKTADPSTADTRTAGTRTAGTVPDHDVPADTKPVDTESPEVGSELVAVEHGPGRVEIRLRRADKRNALTLEMYTTMVAAMERAEADDSVRAVIFSGEGAAFTAGNDLVDFIQNPPTGPDSPVVRFLAALRDAKKVLIAAIHGKTVGVGATMLLHCDYVAAAADTALVFPFVNLALVPEAGSSLLLPQMLGHLRAAEILLTGEPVMAARAYELGLVSKVVAPGEELDAARAFADKLVPLAPQALVQSKELMKLSSTDVATRMEEEISVFSQRLKSPEFAEAVRAFMEKRPPDFSSKG